NFMNTLFKGEFISQSVYRINENTKRILKCLNEIDETETWQRSNENSNSIGNIILHLCGNIRQYAISALGETEDVRMRDKEFSARNGFTKNELFSELRSTVDEAVRIIESLNEERLLKTYSVQGFDLSGIGIIIHVTEHYSYHTGQIAFSIKQLKNKDLGFYAGVNLNEKNKK
ncbi:MAG TPA: DinB family protein, partial [Ginsengibacter sp.]